MTERRQFCPKGHDTFRVGRDASYGCLACKRESGKVARDRRRAEEQAARYAMQAEHLERTRRDYEAWQRRIARYRAKQQRKEK